MAKRRVRVVTDSASDVPRALAEELGITIVPLNVHFGNEVYRDGVDLTQSEFLSRLSKAPVPPSTSQPSVGTFVNAYRSLAPADIISVHIGSGTSGTCNSASLAGQELREQVRVAVVDSKSLTMGSGWLAVLAARAANEGASWEEAVKLAEERVDKAHVLVGLDTLEYLRRGGRIGAVSAFLGSMLSIKPVIRVQDGRLLPIEKLRSLPRCAQRMVELTREAGPFEVLAVGHIANPATSSRMRQDLQDVHPLDSILDIEGGPVIGAHTGPGTIAVMGIRK